MALHQLPKPAARKETAMSRVPIVDPKTAPPPARPCSTPCRPSSASRPTSSASSPTRPRPSRASSASTAPPAGFALDKATQERIALAVAEGNACEYCVSAHTAIGRHAGLSNDEMLLNRRGGSGDAKRRRHRRLRPGAERQPGRGHRRRSSTPRAPPASPTREIVEIIAVVALNVFTNILGKATRVDIDFPKVALLRPAQVAA